MRTLLTTPMRDMSLKSIKAVDKHSMTIVTVRTVGPRFCIWRVAAFAMAAAASRGRYLRIQRFKYRSGGFQGGIADIGGHDISDCPPFPSTLHIQCDSVANEYEVAGSCGESRTQTTLRECAPVVPRQFLSRPLRHRRRRQPKPFEGKGKRVRR